MADIDLEALQALVHSGYHELRIDPEATWERYGMVKAVYHDGLVLFNYTGECNAKPPDTWNEFEGISRGLILNSRTGEVVARPFDKFWNWREESYPSGWDIVEATEKFDGSLGIIYFWKDDWHVATRGSFTSDQAIWADKFLHEHFDLAKFDPSYTYLTEIIYPENRIVVNYGPLEELILIGVRSVKDGTDAFYKDWKQIAEYCGFRTPETIQVEHIRDVVSYLKRLGDNAEGFVARLADGTRIKFKTEEYLQMHKFVSYFSFKHVAEAMMLGILDKVGSICPSSYRSLFEEYINQIESEAHKIESNAYRAHIVCENWALACTNAIDNLSEQSKKEYDRQYKKSYAEMALRESYKPISKLLFMIRDGKHIVPEIYKMIIDSHSDKEEIEENT